MGCIAVFSLPIWIFIIYVVVAEQPVAGLIGLALGAIYFYFRIKK